MGSDKILHRLRAETPFQGTMDVWVKRFSLETGGLMHGQMQAEQRPSSVLEIVDLLEERGRKLVAADEVLERLVHVKSGGHKLLRPHRASVGQDNARRLSSFEQNALDVDLRLIAAAGRDERLHEPAR